MNKNLPPYTQYLDICIGHVYNMSMKAASTYRKTMSEPELANMCDRAAVHDIKNPNIRNENFKNRQNARLKVQEKYGLSPMEAVVMQNISQYGMYLTYRRKSDELKQTVSSLDDEDQKFIDMVSKAFALYDARKQSCRTRRSPDKANAEPKDTVPKYELTDDFIEVDIGKNKSVRAYRIRALKDFADVHKGELGGYVENGQILSQEGGCWVYDDAKVVGKSVIKGDARVKDNAVAVSTEMKDKAVIDKNVHVTHAVMWNESKITDNAVVRNWSTGRIYMHHYACISGDASIKANLDMSGFSKVVSGDFTSNMILGADALIQKPSDYLDLPELGNFGCAFRCADGDVKMKIGSKRMNVLNLGIASFHSVETFRENVNTMPVERSIQNAFYKALDSIYSHFDELSSNDDFKDAINILDNGCPAL